MSKKVSVVKMFDAAQKREIYDAYMSGYTQEEVAKFFSCSVDTVRRVIKEIKAASSVGIEAVVGHTEAAKITETNAISQAATKPFRPEDVVWAGSSKFLSITYGRDTYAADKDHPNFKQALQLCVDGEFEEAINLINIEKAITSYVDGNIRIADGQLFYQDIEIKSGLVDRIINDMQNGEDFEFYLPFLENLLENPSKTAVTRLFDFLQANDIEITEDGHFLAWKVIRNDYTDCYTGKFDNSVGRLVKMPRTHVVEDENRTCEAGLHVCARSYIKHFRGGNDRLVVVKVHPRDVVSIPVDYNNAKMRTCQYKVIREAEYNQETDSYI